MHQCAQPVCLFLKRNEKEEQEKEGTSGHHSLSALPLALSTGMLRTCVWNVASRPTSCGTLDKYLNLSELQGSHSWAWNSPWQQRIYIQTAGILAFWSPRQEDHKFEVT
jgi:hypothetical protein